MKNRSFLAERNSPFLPLNAYFYSVALKLQHQSGVREAGVDEAGRGCLAGPVVAAAVILPEGFRSNGINDSKKLSAGAREELKAIIEEQALAWAVGIISPQRIDQVNILNATYEAMHQAIDSLSLRPGSLLIDGNRFRKHEIPHQCMVKGDARFINIAAASILAKTHRDAIMLQLHEAYPAYGWDRNKGYPTEAHRKAIAGAGITPHHRRSFSLLPDLSLFD